jgi:orotidine-5'-phosphate decarboxylase
VVKFGFYKQCGIIVNSSRAIIYADGTADFANAAKKEAMIIQKEMDQLLQENNIGVSG